MKRQRDTRAKFFSTASFDELSGTKKIQRDNWWAAFWQHLDQDPEAGQIVHRWQKAGCDARTIAFTIHRYVFGYSNKLIAERKKRKKKTKKVLAAAIRSLRELEDLDRIYERTRIASPKKGSFLKSDYRVSRLLSVRSVLGLVGRGLI
jgi:hypothetical protein